MCIFVYAYKTVYTFTHIYYLENTLVCVALVAKSYPTILEPHGAPLSMGFPRQAYWSGLPFPSPGDFPYPELGSNPHVLLPRRILYLRDTKEAQFVGRVNFGGFAL